MPDDFCPFSPKANGVPEIGSLDEEEEYTLGKNI